MGKRSGPRRGSLAFYPRKKAKRIYPSVTSYNQKEEPTLQGFCGYKAGMTYIIATETYDQSPAIGQPRNTPVTILECPPLFVFAIRGYKKTPMGLKATHEIMHDKPPKELARKIKLPKKYKTQEQIKNFEENIPKITEIRAIIQTQPKKIKMKKKPEILELKISGTTEKAWEYAKTILGKEINVNDLFQEGEYIDATGITKGKGTQGPVRRFGIKLQKRNKPKGHIRMPGSIGPWTPARVLYTVPMSGQTGFQRRTVQNTRILKISEGKEISPEGGIINYGTLKTTCLLLKGSIPGPKKRLIVIRHTLRQNIIKKQIPLPTIEHISTVSQQYK